jgi:hypothetical protein
MARLVEGLDRCRLLGRIERHHLAWYLSPHGLTLVERLLSRDIVRVIGRFS